MARVLESHLVVGVAAVAVAALGVVLRVHQPVVVVAVTTTLILRQTLHRQQRQKSDGHREFGAYQAVVAARRILCAQRSSPFNRASVSGKGDERGKGARR